MFKKKEKMFKKKEKILKKKEKMYFFHIKISKLKIK